MTDYHAPEIPDDPHLRDLQRQAADLLQVISLGILEADRPKAAEALTYLQAAARALGPEEWGPNPLLENPEAMLRRLEALPPPGVTHEGDPDASFQEIRRLGLKDIGRLMSPQPPEDPQLRAAALDHPPRECVPIEETQEAWKACPFLPEDGNCTRAFFYFLNLPADCAHCPCVPKRALELLPPLPEPPPEPTADEG